MAKFIFITGGVVSSLGKGISASSLAVLLQAQGYKIRIRKLDPYLNIDPGTMSPIQHGEVFVTEDGAETDMDLGHYERFTGINTKKSDSVTAGKIFAELLAKERKGDYLGKTVQVIPHVTNLIKDFILRDIENDIDFVLCEIGGTVGDIEGLPFFETIRQLGFELGKENCLFIHLTLLPYIKASKELKTKPTQHSVKELRSIGIQPDILLCRSEHKIDEDTRKKIALFCSLKEENVIPAIDVKTIYQVPLEYHKYNFCKIALQHFKMPYNDHPDLSKWDNIVNLTLAKKPEITVAIVGKYIGLEESYKSLVESLDHAGLHNNLLIKIKWVDSRKLTKENLAENLLDVAGIIVPGGFGEGGVDGKILAINYARTSNIPYLGICLGMQMAVLEFARNVAGMKDVYSSEMQEMINENNPPLIGLMKEWIKDGENSKETRNKESDLGGTMRLGSYKCIIEKDSLAFKIYKSNEIAERHRHRYEVNVNYKKDLEKHGMKFSGMSPDGNLPEIIELPNNDFFVAVQFHPELKTRPFTPHPLFYNFVAYSKRHSDKGDTK